MGRKHASLALGGQKQVPLHDMYLFSSSVVPMGTQIIARGALVEGGCA